MTRRTPPSLPALDIRDRPHPTVVLRHELPDGSHHFDWLLAADPDSCGPLLTFRTPVPVLQLEPGDSMLVERLKDHRSMYLEYEGPVSGGRGTVERVGRGTIKWAAMANIEGDRLEWGLTVLWEHPDTLRGLQWLRLILMEDQSWRIAGLSLPHSIGHNGLADAVDAIGASSPSSMA